MASGVTPVLTVCDVIPVYQDEDGSVDLGFMNGLAWGGWEKQEASAYQMTR